MNIKTTINSKNHSRRSLILCLAGTLFAGNYFIPAALAQPRAAPSNTTRNEAGVNQADREEDRELQAVIGRYQQESARLTQAVPSASFVAFWEGEFKKALSATKGSSLLRLRVMDELGTVQGALGKREEALKTCKDMAALAKESGDLRSQAIATGNALGYAEKEPIPTVKLLATEFEDYTQQLATQHDSAETRKSYSDALVRIGTLFATRAKQEQGTNRAGLLEHAMKVLERSAELGEPGQTPVPMRLFWLARSQSELGRREEAAATYAKIAAMNQTVVSRLYMQYLGISESTTKDSPEYREAIEHALKDFTKRGGSDEYEVTLRHYLGLSYRSAQQYDKSTMILSAIIGKSGDTNLDAYNTYLVAMNYKDSGDAGKARPLLNKVQKQYPTTGSAQSAEAEVKEMNSAQRGRWTWSTLFAGGVADSSGWKWTGLFALAGLVMGVVGFVIWRLRKNGGSASVKGT